ncbi:MAG TPA: ABC transporter substrate-binding protein [Chthonomonadaceae bacterium]|nr:ABC transporter substrate-binding protein [Chthonomonadaceae bacterium]
MNARDTVRLYTYGSMAAWPELATLRPALARRPLRHNRREAVTAGLVLLVAAMVAGCGPGGRAEAMSAAGGPLTVHIAYFPNVTHAAALVGTGRGTFAKALGPGVKIDEQVYNAGPSEIEALFAGQVDIGYIGPGPAINGYIRSHGQALKIIAGASSGGAALVVRGDSGIRDVRGLAGKRVAVPQTGGTQDISLRHALQTAGLTSTDMGGSVKVLPNTPADTLTLFVKRELDAAWVPEPWVSRLVKEANGRVVLDERDLWPGKRFATTVIIVRPKFMDQHPDLVLKFLDAHIDSVDWINGHRAEAAALIGARLKTLTGKALPPDVLKSSLARTDITYDPLRASVLTFTAWSRLIGYTHQTPSAFERLVDTEALNALLERRHRPGVR